MIGASETAIYNGANLVSHISRNLESTNLSVYQVRDQEDIIVINFNYRLNVLGFPGAPGLGIGNNNPGFRDVRAVVEWVHANIAAFGGVSFPLFRSVLSFIDRITEPKQTYLIW